ncbi:MAG: formyltransferase family protein [Planctomycetota bacterium]
MRVLIAGKNELAVALFEALAEADIELGFVTCSGEATDGKREALKLSLEAAGLQPLNSDHTHRELLRVVHDWQPDVLLSAGFDKIIKPEVIAAVPHVLNVHFGDLPRYRGSYSIPWAILNRDASIGVTLHCVDPGIDSGAIYAQRHILNDPGESARELYDSCVDLGVKMVEEWLYQLGTGHPPTPVPQNEVEATYYPLEFPGHYRIEWQQTVRWVYDYIRACSFAPYPGAHSSLCGVEVEIEFPVSFELATVTAPPGTIVDVAGRAAVTTLNGVIVPRKVVVGGQGCDLTPRDFTAWVIEKELHGERLGVAATAVVSSP